jgi:hypothetical protein
VANEKAGLNMNDTWFGNAELIGGTAVFADKYPISGRRVNDEVGEIVEYDFHEPIEIPGPFGRKLLSQKISIRVIAEENHVEELAIDTLRCIADTLSFFSGRAPEISIDSFTTSLPEAKEGARTILKLQPIKHPAKLIRISSNDMASLWNSIGDLESERGRRIVRAMRWYGRSVSAVDEFEEFSCLAFGYEALKGIINPFACKTKENLTKKRKINREKSELSEPLRAFAIYRAGIKEEDWKRVGKLRHRLFHGCSSGKTSSLPAIACGTPGL